MTAGANLLIGLQHGTHASKLRPLIRHLSAPPAPPAVQANSQIVNCRRILKWTYAYGYYKFDTLTLPTRAGDGVTAAQVAEAKARKQRTEERKVLFEFLQGEAESALEKLSGLMDRDLKRFMHPDDFWRHAKKSGSLAARPAVRAGAARCDWALPCMQHAARHALARFAAALLASLRAQINW